MGIGRETEESFAAAVLALAKLHGWRTLHVRPARTARGWRTPVQGDGCGFQDLLLVHPGRGLLLVAELKVGRNSPTPDQRSWLDAFAAADVPALVWTPDDWDEIRRTLAPPA